MSINIYSAFLPSKNTSYAHTVGRAIRSASTGKKQYSGKNGSREKNDRFQVSGRIHACRSGRTDTEKAREGYGSIQKRIIPLIHRKNPPMKPGDFFWDYSTTIFPFRAVTLTVSDFFPRMMLSAIASSILSWIYRLTGRAPNSGS